MPLTHTRDLFAKALKGKYALGAFNVNNMELIQAIVEACEEEKAPLMLQISKGAREYANPVYLKKLIEAAVSLSNIPIAIHLDHGDTGIGKQDEEVGLDIAVARICAEEIGLGATSVVAAIRKQDDIAIGNVVGSNVFNILGVVGIAGLIHPDVVASLVLSRDSVVMVLLSVALAVLCFRAMKGGAITRWQGGLLVAAYVGYNLSLAADVILS